MRTLEYDRYACYFYVELVFNSDLTYLSLFGT